MKLCVQIPFLTLYSALSITIQAQVKPDAAKVALSAGSSWGTPLTLETGTDQGAIACAASTLQPNLRNGNTDQAFQNLSTQPNSGSVAVIMGQGNSGTICTGDGVTATHLIPL